MTASNCPCRGCPRNCKRRILRHHATGLSGPGKAAEGGDPRARRPAVSRGHARACRSGCTDSSRTNRPYGTAGETSFAVTHHLSCHPRSLPCVPLCFLRRRAALPRLLRSCCVVRSRMLSRARAQDATPIRRDPAGHRRDLHPHRHPQQWQQRQRQQDQRQHAAATIASPPATGSAVVGRHRRASTTIITSEDIERAPSPTLQDILSREAGIQIDQSVRRRQRHRHDGGHARLRRHRAIQYAGAGRWTPLQRSRYRRVRSSV